MTRWTSQPWPRWSTWRRCTFRSATTGVQARTRQHSREGSCSEQMLAQSQMLAHALSAPTSTPQQDTTARGCAAPLLVHSEILLSMFRHQSMPGKGTSLLLHTGAGRQGNGPAECSTTKETPAMKQQSFQVLHQQVPALGHRHPALSEVPAAGTDNSVPVTVL